MQKSFEIEQGGPEIWGFKGLGMILLHFVLFSCKLIEFWSFSYPAKDMDLLLLCGGKIDQHFNVRRIPIRDFCMDLGNSSSSTFKK